MSSRAPITALAATLAGCNVCGTYTYRGQEIEEHCGIVYGTTGTWYREDGVVELEIGSSTPVGRTGISFRPSEPDLRIAFSDVHLSAGAVVPEDEIEARCTLPTGEWLTVEQVAVEVGRSGFDPNLDPTAEATRRRRFTWSIRCEEGLIASEASDVVELRVLEASSPWPTLSAEGGE